MLLFSHKRESGELYSTHCLSFIYYYVVIVLLATNFNRNHNQFHFIPRKISSYMAYICILFFYSNTITSIYTWIIKKSSFGLLPHTRNCSLAIQIDFILFHFLFFFSWLLKSSGTIILGLKMSMEWNRVESETKINPKIHRNYISI